MSWHLLTVELPRRYQGQQNGGKHERLSDLLRISSPDSTSDETSGAFAGARRGVHETRDTFAGGKWLEFGCFVRAEVSVVSFCGSDPPALVSSVLGEVVGRCCEVAVVPISAKQLAEQAWIPGETGTKFALLAKKR